MRTMKELAREAIDIQDACSLSGVVHSFSRAMSDLREIMRAQGLEDTDKINTHPVAVLYASKIESLTRLYRSEAFTVSYDWAKKEVKS